MIIERVLCLFGKHVRSHSRAHVDGYAYISECRHCGTPMVRRSDGIWAVDRPIRLHGPTTTI